MYKKRGFTIVEFLLILTLIGVISTVGVGISYNSLSRTSLSEERDRLATVILPKQRMRALTNINNTHHGVHIDQNSFILFEGDSFDKNDEGNQYIPRNQNVKIEEVDIIFEQRSGNVLTGSNTIVLETDIASHTISIHSQGRIDW